MQNLETTMTEGKATEIIFKACRDNEQRNPATIAYCGYNYDVTFKLNADGTHEAAVRNFEGVVVAIAKVDKFDC